MSKATHRIAETWALLGGLLLLAIMAVTSLNAVGFGLDRIARVWGASVPGLPGYEDFVRLAISGAALMFLPVCQSRNGHVTVDLFARLLPDGLSRVLDRVWLLAIVLLALFLAYWMTFGLIETRQDNALSPILAWPVWPFYAPGVISLLLWAGVAAVQLIEGARDV